MACVSLTSRNVRLRTTLTFGARWHPLATADVQLEMLPGLCARRHHLNTQHGFLCMCAKCEADSKEKEESAEPTETQGKRAAAAVATAVATANEDIAMHQAGEPEFMNVAELLAAQSTSVGGGTQDTLAAFDARLVDRFVSAQVMGSVGRPSWRPPRTAPFLTTTLRRARVNLRVHLPNLRVHLPNLPLRPRFRRERMRRPRHSSRSARCFRRTQLPRRLSAG